MTLNRMVLFGLLMTVSQIALAIDCYELGAQAEMSIHINSKTNKGKLQVGEEIKFKAKKQNVGGSLATYNFKATGNSYSLSVLNEPVSSNDNRYRGVLTELNSIERTFLGCNL
jgi:hypothetical protein